MLLGGMVTSSVLPSWMWTVACPSATSVAPTRRLTARLHAEAVCLLCSLEGHSRSLCRPVQEVDGCVLLRCFCRLVQEEDGCVPLWSLAAPSRRWTVRLPAKAGRRAVPPQVAGLGLCCSIQQLHDSVSLPCLCRPVKEPCPGDARSRRGTPPCPVNGRRDGAWPIHQPLRPGDGWRHLAPRHRKVI